MFLVRSGETLIQISIKETNRIGIPKILLF